MNSKLAFGLIAIFIIFAGCCGPASSSTSGFCPYSTYGSACSTMCSQQGQGDSCTSKCLDLVRSEGLGDATTCCKTTYRQGCDTMCAEAPNIPKSECMSDCVSQFSDFGISVDTCQLPV